MKMKFVSQIVKGVESVIKKHGTEIAIGLGIGGMLAGTVMAVAATPKALEDIEMEKDRQNQEIIKAAEEAGEESFEIIDKLPPVDVVKACWKNYIPAAATCLLSAGCIIGANSAHVKRNAALATAYKLSETALTEYHDKVVEVVGEKKEQEIQDEISKDRVRKNPPVNKEVIITGSGQTTCLDTISGRYFKSDIETIRKIENDLNYRMRDEMYISLNELYYELGLTYTELGETMGWNVDRGQIDIDYSAQLAENGEPVIVLRHRNPPRYEYQH